MRKFLIVKILIVVGLLFGSAIFSNAQTTSDSLIFNANNVSLLGGGTFNYINGNTSVSGFLREGNFGPGNCNCYAGDTVNFDSLFSGSLSIVGGSPGVVNGVSYERIFFSGNLRFDSESYVMPHRYTRNRFAVTFPATLSGTLRAYTQNPFAGNVEPIAVFNISLQGNVTAALKVSRIDQSQPPARPIYRILNVKYDFPNASQTSQNAAKEIELKQ